MSSYIKSINQSRSDLLKSRIGLLTKTSYSNFFRGDQLIINKVMSAFPKIDYPLNPDENTITQRLAYMVKEYTELNIIQRLWWRLTSPIRHYIVLHDILTLTAMKNLAAKGQLLKSREIYNQSSLNNLRHLFEASFSTWRNALHELIPDAVPPEQQRETTPSLLNQPIESQEQVDLKQRVKDLVNTIGLFFEEIDRTPNSSNEHNICELKKLQHSSKHLLLLIHPDKNPYWQDEANRLTSTVADIKSQVEEQIYAIQKNKWLDPEQLFTEQCSKLDQEMDSTLNELKQKINRVPGQSNQVYNQLRKEILELVDQSERIYDQMRQTYLDEYDRLWQDVKQLTVLSNLKCAQIKEKNNQLSNEMKQFRNKYVTNVSDVMNLLDNFNLQEDITANNPAVYNPSFYRSTELKTLDLVPHHFSRLNNQLDYQP